MDEAGIEDLFDATTSDLAFATAGDTVYLAVDNGTNTYIFHLVDTNSDGEFRAANDAGTLALTLTGITDATTLTGDNFSDFA